MTVGAGTPAQSSPPYEGGVAEGRGGSLLVLDWRKIKGHEGKSTISNVTVNGKPVVLLPRENHPVAEAATPLLRKEGNQDAAAAFHYVEQNEHLIFRDGVVAGENVIKLDFTSPILTSGSAITRYVDKEDGSEYIYSLFVPSDASTAFPVFDQPDLKARFQLNLIVPIDWKVVSNSTPQDARRLDRSASRRQDQEGFITLAYNTLCVPDNRNPSAPTSSRSRRGRGSVSVART